MNKIVEDIKNAIKVDMPRTPDSVIINAIHYMMGTLTGTKRVNLDFDGDVMPLHYYGITLAPSGVGKDRAVEEVFGITDGMFDSYIDRVAMEHSKLCATTEEPWVMPVLEFNKGTTEGFAFCRSTLQEIGFGVTNFRVNELGDVVASEDFRSTISDLVQAYEKGDTSAKLIKGGKAVTVTGVPVNMLIYGSPYRFKEDAKIEDKVKEMMASGLARRSFVVMGERIEGEDKEQTREERLAKRSKKKDVNSEKNRLSVYVDDIRQNCPSTVTVDDDAFIAYDKYSDDCRRNSRNDKTLPEAIKVEVENRAWKALRLAGIYAVFDGTKVVCEKNMLDAIEWTESRDHDVKELLRRRTNEERIFDYLERHDEFVTRQQIKTEAIGTISKVEFEYSMEIIHEYAERRDAVIIEKIEGVKNFYMIEQAQKIDSSEIRMSISNDLAKGFVTKTGSWDKFDEILKSGFNYSAGSFKDNHRTKDNYMGEQDVVILDIDDGIPIEAAKTFFGEWDCWIATTKSHQKEKNGLICDRFRVVLLPNIKIKMDADTYSEFMANIMDGLGGFADPSCKDASRFYYGFKESEVWKSDSTKPFDIRDYIPETKRQREVFAESGKITDATKLEKFFIKEANIRNRNDHLYRYANMMRESGENWESKVIEINEKLNEPLPMKELESSIIASISRNK
jgi:hypothetical protein